VPSTEIRSGDGSAFGAVSRPPIASAHSRILVNPSGNSFLSMSHTPFGSDQPMSMVKESRAAPFFLNRLSSNCFISPRISDSRNGTGEVHQECQLNLRTTQRHRQPFVAGLQQ